VQQSEDLTKAIKQDRIENNLAKIDQERIQQIRNLFNIVNGYCSMASENITIPARRLKRILDKYGRSIIFENYDEKSASIESLLMDLNNDSVRNDINQLNCLNDCIQKLRTLENSFKATSIDVTKNKAILKQRKSASMLKIELMETINSLLMTHLRNAVKCEPAKYSNLYNTINLLIEHTNSIIKRRTNDDKKAEPDNVDDTGKISA